MIFEMWEDLCECKERGKMIFIVAYDISHPKRLRKVAKTCEDYGVRVEYSIFECDLKEEMFSQMWTELYDLIDEDEDSLLAYRICKNCVEKIKSVGKVKRPEKVLLYMP
ncbi:MAG: hypothetical protein ACD_79C00497G0002 [uncultured bacterium]|nr:MAG: hypothetical protein ACD_79C00497G0002 [uncultured bacterium]